MVSEDTFPQTGYNSSWDISNRNVAGLRIWLSPSQIQTHDKYRHRGRWTRRAGVCGGSGPGLRAKGIASPSVCGAGPEVCLMGKHTIDCNGFLKRMPAENVGKRLYRCDSAIGPQWIYTTC
ncbi:hypothetical protein AAFF_G00192050 [Aldrovandia affinis]|uniref:Uncharacterized protein n=1 Tax=Aldrovandia affinis TaxID=143900 RepID=A0AAD7W6Z7_9TELE|nr:hypothetical protein AAFF_G00192050 [Aldrovandia affinis]